MISTINFYYELYKIYRGLGLTKKQVWIRLKKLGFKNSLLSSLDNMYKLDLKRIIGGLMK